MFAEKMSHEAPLVQPMQPVFGANLGLDASQIAQSQTTMMMNEHKSWSAGDFSITRDDGSEMFKSQGKFKSLTERRGKSDFQSEACFHFTIVKNMRLAIQFSLNVGMAS